MGTEIVTTRAPWKFGTLGRHAIVEKDVRLGLLVRRWLAVQRCTR
jgi:hypothetical protein